MSASTSYVVGVRINGDARGLSKAAQEALHAQRMLAGGSVREYQRMADARSKLGVRSEREVQREITQTQAAYNRLARSGTLSWQEQRMAAKGMREEVTRLTNEMGRMTRAQKLALAGKGALALGGAAVATAAMLKPKLDTAMSYDYRLRQVVNTKVDPNASKAERYREKTEIEQAILDANRYGGGDRDTALQAYNRMVANGDTFTGNLPNQLMRPIMKASTATGTVPDDMANILAASIQNFGMKRSADEAAKWLNIAAYGGKVGSFETANLARHLPAQMAAARGAGMKGKEDFAGLVMLNEAAVKTAGTPDQAATNVNQFLTDLKSSHFGLRARQALPGFNFTKYAVQQRLSNGQGMIDSSMDVVEMLLKKHPAYQQVQKKLASANTPDERKSALEAAEQMIRGSQAARLFHNQESSNVVAAYMQNREWIKRGQKDMLGGADVIGGNQEFLAESPQYQANRATIESANSMQTAMEKLTPTFGTLMGGVANLMQQYPGYTGAVIGATGALVALGTAAGGLALLGLRLPGGIGGAPKPGGLPTGMPKTAPFPTLEGAPGAGAARGVMAGAGRSVGAFGKLAGRLPMLGLGLELFGTSSDEIRILKEAEQAKAHRGLGFDDPRLLTRASPQSLEERLNGVTPGNRTPGEINVSVNVSAAPGLNVQAEASTKTPGLTVRSDAGRTMLGMGQ